jgi:hypothetical protein
VHHNTLTQLDELLKLCMEFEAVELLLLPPIRDEKFILSESEWLMLRRWIDKNSHIFPLRILHQAKNFINISSLFNDDDYEGNYAYISPDLILKTDSYSKEGLKLNIRNGISNAIKDWHTNIFLTCSTRTPRTTRVR